MPLGVVAHHTLLVDCSQTLKKSAQMLQNSEKSGPVLLRVGVEVALFPGHR